MHIRTNIDVRPNGFAGRRYLIDHPLQLSRARCPVVGIILVRVISLIQIELDRRKSHVGGFGGTLGKLLRRRQPKLIQRRIHVDPDPVAKLPAQELIHRQAQRLAGKVPQCCFDRRQHGNVHARLGSFKKAGSANVLEQPVHV